MPRGREPAHIGTDLSDDDLNGGDANPRNLRQPFDDVMKGRQCGLDPGVEGRNAFFQMLDRLACLRVESGSVRQSPRFPAKRPSGT